jgi:hypothetical protein
VIAAGLIVGDGIAGAEIEDLEVRGVLADAEGDADETGARAAGRLDGDGGEVDVDGAVTEICAFNDGKSIAVGNVAGEADGFAAEVFGGLRFDAVFDEGGGVGEGEGLGGRRRVLRGGDGGENKQRSGNKDGAREMRGSLHADDGRGGETGRQGFCYEWARCGDEELPEQARGKGAWMRRSEVRSQERPMARACGVMRLVLAAYVGLRGERSGGAGRGMTGVPRTGHRQVIRFYDAVGKAVNGTSARGKELV